MGITSATARVRSQVSQHARAASAENRAASSSDSTSNAASAASSNTPAALEPGDSFTRGSTANQALNAIGSTGTAALSATSPSPASRATAHAGLGGQSPTSTSATGAAESGASRLTAADRESAVRSNALDQLFDRISTSSNLNHLPDELPDGGTQVSLFAGERDANLRNAGESWFDGVRGEITSDREVRQSYGSAMGMDGANPYQFEQRLRPLVNGRLRTTFPDANETQIARASYSIVRNLSQARTECQRDGVENAYPRAWDPANREADRNRAQANLQQSRYSGPGALSRLYHQTVLPTLYNAAGSHRAEDATAVHDNSTPVDSRSNDSTGRYPVETAEEVRNRNDELLSSAPRDVQVAFNEMNSNRPEGRESRRVGDYLVNHNPHNRENPIQIFRYNSTDRSDYGRGFMGTARYRAAQVTNRQFRIYCEGAHYSPSEVRAYSRQADNNSIGEGMTGLKDIQNLGANGYRNVLSAFGPSEHNLTESDLRTLDQAAVREFPIEQPAMHDFVDAVNGFWAHPFAGE